MYIKRLLSLVLIMTLLIGIIPVRAFEINSATYEEAQRFNPSS